jgi:hypothetical protein
VKHSEGNQMVDEQMLYVPKANMPALSHLLAKNISAIELITGNGDRQSRLGPVLQLPNGSMLDVCGDGFNDRTVKIRSNGKYYFVFRSDLGIN